MEKKTYSFADYEIKAFQEADFLFKHRDHAHALSFPFMCIFVFVYLNI